MAGGTSGNPGGVSSRPASVLERLPVTRGDLPRRRCDTVSPWDRLSGPPFQGPKAPHSRAGVLKGSDSITARFFQPHRRTPLPQTRRGAALQLRRRTEPRPGRAGRRGGARGGAGARGAGRGGLRPAAAHFRRAAFPGRGCLAGARPTARPPWGPAGLACQRRAGDGSSAAPRCCCCRCSCRPPRSRRRPGRVRTAQGAGLTAPWGRRPTPPGPRTAGRPSVRSGGSGRGGGAWRGQARPLFWFRPRGRAPRGCCARGSGPRPARRAARFRGACGAGLAQRTALP